MKITNMDDALFLGFNFPHYSEKPIYIFLIKEGHKLYKKLRILDHVSFMDGEHKIIAEIYYIEHLDGYNRYCCEEVKENDNI